LMNEIMAFPVIINICKHDRASALSQHCHRSGGTHLLVMASAFWVLLCASKHKKFQGYRAHAEHRSFLEQGINQSVCVEFLQNTDTHHRRLSWPFSTKHPFLEKPSTP
jgi:hypothetical protein